MEQHSIARIKCAMIIYELERTLGRYVREKSNSLHDSNTALEIIKRLPSVPQSDHETTKLVVENSYLGEILALAQAVSKGTSDSVQLNILEKLCFALGIFDIRNAISHPNRPFADCYWYRCAAIAADPSIDTVGFFEVSLALQNAEEGKLQEPPEDWMYKKRWSVPAILPTDFEHSITGLFGRSKDTAQLLKEIKNRRAPLIAVVAKGGVGKTSLMLQVVSDFCLSTEASQYFDGVIWTSFKQERLTSSGIQILTAPASLGEMQDLICRQASEIFGEEFIDFEDIKEKLGNKRLLLCLDNLETLLRDSPTSFNDFYEALPENWRVIVTSRIPVDSAKNVPLGVLDKQGATSLARAYLHSKGHHGASPEVLEKISFGCNFNPLAIRLTIELYLSGAEIGEALRKSEKDVLAFSFTNLLDQLSPLENDVLETVFALEAPNRSEICGALDSGTEEVAEAISKLSKTSLISRLENESAETYSLGSSIRDLLRANPRSLAIRSKAAAWLAKSKSTAESALQFQQERNISPADLHYIPQNTPATFIAISKQIKAAVKREDRAALVQIEGDLRHRLTAESESSFLRRLYARTTLELDDIPTAITQFQRAAALDTDDPAPLFGLALSYQSQSNAPDTYAVTKSLLDKGWGEVEKAGIHHANRIWGMFLHSANVAEKYSQVFEATKDWELKLKTLPSHAISRASAYRRQANAEFRRNECDTKRLGSLLAKAAKPMLKTLISEGFAKWILSELRKFSSELRYLHSRGVKLQDFDTDDRDALSNLLQYCLSNRASWSGIDATESITLMHLFSGRELGADQPSTASAKASFLDRGYTCGKVKRGMRSDTSFVFVQDEVGTDYFVHMDIFEHGDLQRRRSLFPGIEIALKHEPGRTGNALRATEAWLVS